MRQPCSGAEMIDADHCVWNTCGIKKRDRFRRIQQQTTILTHLHGCQVYSFHASRNRVKPTHDLCTVFVEKSHYPNPIRITPHQGLADHQMQTIGYDFTIHVSLINRVISTKKCIFKWPRHTSYITWALIPFLGLKLGKRLQKNSRVDGKVIAYTLRQTRFLETFAI